MMDLDTPETCTRWRNILRISCASSWFFFTRYYILFVNCITETIQVTESPIYFPRGPHVDQPCSIGFWPCHIILWLTHCLNFARHPLSRMKIKTKCFADLGTRLLHHKSMQSKGPKNRWAPRAHIYLLLGCTALPSNSFSLWGATSPLC